MASQRNRRGAWGGKECQPAMLQASHSPAFEDPAPGQPPPGPASGGRGGKGVFRHLDGLAVRLAWGVTLLVVSLLAVGLYVLSRLHFNRTIEARRQAAELQNRILAAALGHQMIEKDRTLIEAILREIGTEPEVQTSMILDHEGVVKFSNRPDLVGNTIPRESPTCLVCHSKSQEERERWALLGGDKVGVLRSVLPFENRQPCQQCHDPKRRINGILILDISLAEVEAQLRRDAMWMGGGTILLGLLLLSGVSLVVRHLVLVRLGKLGRAARSIAAGNLTERAPVEGHDRIASLARDFNNMAEATSRLISEVRERESQLASVMNSLDDGLVVLDRDFRVLGANRSFSRRLGKHPETLRYLVCHDAVGGELPCSPSGEDCPAGRCLATGEVQRAVFRETDNHGRIEEVYASPILDSDGKVVQVVEIWRDITDRVREEERLAEVERLVSLGVLASGFSHEVSTPLASMLTCAESVLGRIGESAEPGGAEVILPAIRESADTIRREVLRCRKITEQFRRFSRGIPPSVEAVDVRGVVEGVVALVTPTAREARVSVVISGDDAVPCVAANTEVVQHVVLNLLVNAVQSCDHRGGSIDIRFHADSSMHIRIRDTGRGIAPDDRKHLFEPFRSRKPHGTGLGLFLSRSFMRRFGGDVHLVESTVGEGSCFEIIFPLKEKEEAT